ncbi:protein of unknown function (plasmid) [Cupriavidus neocaledonicus]|uniref:Aldehyde dehydrogenase domain-containing protein n=1 Tax=Cupriavidus neocaledonicus TaxID=1040979 RepID=A0A375HRY8_9BURK|nr:hypothetical protein CBM2605_B110136 [Cupriavidus neocaledonicus]SPD59746.1 protein of unknown function [Cupriavidus neocaledonicus]
MHSVDKFYIHGKWVQPAEGATQADIIDPATEAVAGTLAMGTAADVDRAVAAARQAFPAWSVSTRETRIALLERIIAAYQARMADLAQAVRQEIGAPITLATNLQAAIGLAQLQATLQALRDFAFESPRGKSLVLREAIGVAALITPWNWPLNQIAAKVAPALAAGCTVVLKPSEIAPLDAQIFAEIMDAAGTPPGVFNHDLWRRPRGGCRAVVASRGRHGVDHRLDPRRRGSGHQRRADGQARGAGARRQVAADRAGRRRPAGRGHQRRGPVHGQFGPDLRGAHARAGAARTLRGSGANRGGGGQCGEGGRSVGPRDQDGADFQPRPVRQGAAPDRRRHRGRRAAGRRRPGPPRRPGARLLCPSDCLCRRAQRHDHRSRGNLRAGAVPVAVRQRRGSRGHRQRHGFRPGGLCRLVRPGTGAQAGGAAARRQCAHQRRDDGYHRALRRLQDFRQRPRVRPRGHRRVPRDQDRDWLKSALPLRAGHDPPGRQRKAGRRAVSSARRMPARCRACLTSAGGGVRQANA